MFIHMRGEKSGKAGMGGYTFAGCITHTGPITVALYSANLLTP